MFYLGKKETLNTEKKILSGYLADETANKDYKVEVTESYSEEEYLPPVLYFKHLYLKEIHISIFV